jgi:hypothetical protein
MIISRIQTCNQAVKSKQRQQIISSKNKPAEYTSRKNVRRVTTIMPRYKKAYVKTNSVLQITN